MFQTYLNLSHHVRTNNHKSTVTRFIEKSIDRVVRLSKHPKTNMKNELEDLSNNIEPFIVAEKISDRNNASIQTVTFFYSIFIRLMKISSEERNKFNH